MSVNERGCGSNPHLGTKRKHRYTLGCRAVSWAVLSYTARETRRRRRYPCRHRRRPASLFCAPGEAKISLRILASAPCSPRLGAASNRMSALILCWRTLQKSLRTCHSRHRRSSVPNVALVRKGISSAPCREPSASTLTALCKGRLSDRTR
jgi:hypothetical protein